MQGSAEETSGGTFEVTATSGSRQASDSTSLHKAAVKIQSQYRGFAVRKAYKVLAEPCQWSIQDPSPSLSTGLWILTAHCASS